MSVIKGDARLSDFKEQLRKNMTEPEKMLWNKLRDRQLSHLKFRRQHGIGPYIVDFYCAEKKIVVEVDGDTHGGTEQERRDRERESFLISLGLNVVRYTNQEVMKNIEEVMQDLMDKIN